MNQKADKLRSQLDKIFAYEELRSPEKTASHSFSLKHSQK